LARASTKNKQEQPQEDRHLLSEKLISCLRQFIGDEDRAGKRGRPPMPVEAVLQALSWLLSAGAPWRDLPASLGKWQTVYGRFRKWVKEGLAGKILESIAAEPAGEGM